MSRFLNTKPVTSEGLHKFLSFTLAPVIQMMDDAIRRINIHVGERSWYRYGFLRFTGRLSPQNALFHSFKLRIFKLVCGSVWILFFIVFADIGDQLVPFAK